MKLNTRHKEKTSKLKFAQSGEREIKHIQRSYVTQQGDRETQLTVFPEMKLEGMVGSIVRNNAKNFPELKT